MNCLVVAAFAVTVTYLYCYIARIFSYWSKLGIKQDSLYNSLCMIKRQCLNEISDAEVFENLYSKYPEEKIVGSYSGTKPLIIIKDPELIKRVLVTDFDHFYSRAVHPLGEVPEPLINNLVSCEGDLWKLLRQSLSPIFSTRKIKDLFSRIMTIADKLQQIATKNDSVEIDVKNLMHRYSTDVTGAFGFGINTNTLNGKNTAFLKLGRRIFTKTTRDMIVYLLKCYMPRWFSSLHLVSPFVEETTNVLVKSIMKQRNCKTSDKKDFIDLLLELKEQGKIIGNSLTTRNPDGSLCKVELKFNDSLLAAQIFTFFAGGTDTTASATSCVLNELAHHPEYQRKCQEEIDEVLERCGQLNFEAIKEMKYLDQCFRESMRLFPPIGYLMRKCVKSYAIPGSIIIDSGVLIVIPIKALHEDKKYFPDPERFCPNRFHSDNVFRINKYTYLPFGAGPRACIGERLGRMQSLAALASLLRHASFTTARESRRSPLLDPRAALVQRVRGPLPLKIVKRTRKINEECLTSRKKACNC